MRKHFHIITGFFIYLFLGYLLISTHNVDAGPIASDESGGKEFLIGWYSGIEGKGSLAEHASTGVNIMMPYTNGDYEKNNRESHIGPYLDEAARHNIRVLVEPNRRWIDTANWDSLREFVKKFKDYPALYGWYLFDEPDVNDISPTKLQNAYLAVKKEDPNHPIAVAFVTKIVSGYYKAFDIMMFDRYPCYVDTPEFGGKIDLIDNAVESCLEIVNEEKKLGFIMILQGYGRNEHGIPQWRHRDPTYGEARYMTYTSAIRDTLGVMYFADYRCQTPELKKTMKTLIKEVSSLKSVIPKGKFNDPSVKCSQNGSIDYSYCVDGKLYYLIAVNASSHRQSKVKFTLPFGLKVDNDNIEVLNESSKISVSSQAFTDDFEKFEVHIYKFKDYESSRSKSVY